MHSESLLFESGYATDPGRVRTDNQDAVCVQVIRGGRLLALADGMGGHLGGSLAANLAIQTACETVARESEEASSSQDAPSILMNAFLQANRRVRQEAKARPEFRGMGTTLVLAWQIGEQVYYAHVGDSRLYLVANDGQVKALTADHTSVQAMVDAGILTAEQAANHPEAHRLVRSIGHQDEVEPTLCAEPLEMQPGDLIIACSDGIHGMIAPEAFVTCMELPTAQIAKCLVDQANQAGGRDNASAVVLRRVKAKQEKGHRLAEDQGQQVPQPAARRRQRLLRKLRPYLIGLVGGSALALLLMLVLHLCTGGFDGPETTQQSTDGPTGKPSLGTGTVGATDQDLPGTPAPVPAQTAAASGQAADGAGAAPAATADAGHTQQIDVVASSTGGKEVVADIKSQPSDPPVVKPSGPPGPEDAPPPCAISTDMDEGTKAQVESYLVQRSKLDSALKSADWGAVKGAYDAAAILATAMVPSARKGCEADMELAAVEIAERIVTFISGRVKRKGCGAACGDLLALKRRFPRNAIPNQDMLEGVLSAECLEACRARGLVLPAAEVEQPGLRPAMERVERAPAPAAPPPRATSPAPASPELAPPEQVPPPPEPAAEPAPKTPKPPLTGQPAAKGGIWEGEAGKEAKGIRVLGTRNTDGEE